jgi:hypothetical protein
MKYSGKCFKINFKKKATGGRFNLAELRHAFGIFFIACEIVPRGLVRMPKPRQLDTALWDSAPARSAIKEEAMQQLTMQFSSCLEL